jgi:hypothetical protein
VGHTHYTPRLVTIAVSAILVLVGLAGTFGNLIPDTYGVYAFVAAFVLMVLGLFVRQI